MCFNQKYSATFAILGIISLLVIRNNPPKENNLLYIPIIFYTLMEILQTFQYSYVNKCDSMNKFLCCCLYLPCNFSTVASKYSSEKMIISRSRNADKI